MGPLITSALFGVCIGAPHVRKLPGMNNWFMVCYTVAALGVWGHTSELLL